MSEQIKCLDKGFVRLVAVGGNDQLICDAARLSYKNAPRPMISDDAKLIDYLLEHSHTSPFEQVVFWFHCKMPIFVARQWVRHRTARLNELSGRYSQMPDEYYIPELDQLKLQSSINKQGRDDELVVQTQVVQDVIADSAKTSFDRYDKLLSQGLTKELSRIVLPLNTYTEWYWQMDLHNLFHFLKLRLDNHAQYEIRVYAEAMAQFVRQAVPLAWESYERHVLHAEKFSADELTLLHELIYKLTNPELDRCNVMETVVYPLIENSPALKASNNRKVRALFKKLGINKSE
jgi:thymidylate synthase (FAD)